MAKVIAVRHKKAWRHAGAKGKVAKARKKAWRVQDRGAPGKTPKAKRFLKVGRKLKGQLGTGYTDLSTSERRAKLRALDRRPDVSSRSVWSHMQGLANVTTDRQARKVFKSDAQWTMRNLMNRKEKLAMTRKARTKRKK